MARKYSATSITSLDSGKDPMPMEKKRVMIGCTPTEPNMMIDPSWDSIQGIDSSIRNSLAGITKKRK
jgi:hypothetical protein